MPGPSGPAARPAAPPTILAHRGAPLPGVEENSIRAFAAALAAGADVLETDARATSDGVAVLVHDETLPAPHGAVPVRALMIADLRRGWPAVCTAADAFAALPGASWNVDVKSADAAAPLGAAIRGAGAADRVRLAGFARRRRRAAAAAVGVAVAQSASPAEVAAILLAAVILPRRALAGIVALIGVRALQVPPAAGPLRIVRRRLVSRLAAVGVETHVWTINDPAVAADLVAIGVRGVVTDDVPAIAAALRR